MIRGELYMKITKSSLQNIIRKEFQILLEEMSLINEQELVDIGDIPLTSDQPTEIDFEKDTRQRKRRRSRWNTKCHPHKLKKGCKTAYVKSLQAKLKKLGYNLGKGGAKDDGVDGRFGNATHAAVIDFQKRNGSNPSGVGDSDFWSKLQGQRAKGPRKADPTRTQKSAKVAQQGAKEITFGDGEGSSITAKKPTKTGKNKPWDHGMTTQQKIAARLAPRKKWTPDEIAQRKAQREKEYQTGQREKESAKRAKLKQNIARDKGRRQGKQTPKPTDREEYLAKLRKRAGYTESLSKKNMPKAKLKALLLESVEHEGLQCTEVHPDNTHNEWSEHKKEEEKKTKAMAKISIKPRIIKIRKK